MEALVAGAGDYGAGDESSHDDEPALRQAACDDLWQLVVHVLHEQEQDHGVGVQAQKTRFKLKATFSLP